MTNIYPIRTILMTRRLSQASLYAELFGDENLRSCCRDDKGAALVELLGEEPIIIKGFDPNADWWEVNVAPENQTWLSPAPIAADIGKFLVGQWPDGEKAFVCGEVYFEDEVFWVKTEDAHPEIIQSPDNVIFKRTYANGILENFIKWEEVILPNGE